MKKIIFIDFDGVLNTEYYMPVFWLSLYISTNIQTTFATAMNEFVPHKIDAEESLRADARGDAKSVVNDEYQTKKTLPHRQSFYFISSANYSAATVQFEPFLTAL